MKANQIAGRCVLAVVFVYLLIQIYYLYNHIMPSADKEPWRDFVCLFLIQSVFFAVCIFAVFVFLFLQRFIHDNTSPFETLLVVNSDGKIKREVLLSDKHSFLITGAKNGKDIFVESIYNSESSRHLYGVCNLVKGCWYFEVMSKGRPVGLKRGCENVIYRLKEGMLYRLTAADVLYADTYKIVMSERKVTGAPQE